MDVIIFFLLLEIALHLGAIKRKTYDTILAVAAGVILIGGGILFLLLCAYGCSPK